MNDARSPRYPRIPLLAAVGYAQKFYEEAHRSEVETDTAYKILGFSGKSGTSATVLGALRQYGLLSGLRGNVRISPLSLTILEPSSDMERIDALITAAHKPDIFSDIIQHFENNVPKSNEAIRAYLIRARGFGSAGANDCIESYRKTFSDLADIMAQQPPPEFMEPTIYSADDMDDEIDSSVLPPRMPRETLGSFSKDISFALSKTTSVQLRFQGEISATSLERLIQQIEIMKEIWSEE